MEPVQGAFRALSDPTRRAILVHLSQSDMTIAEISDRFDVTRAAIRKHLTILEEGRLISVRSSGRERFSHLEPDALKIVAEWISYFDQFWDQRLENLKTAIHKHEEQKNDKK